MPPIWGVPNGGGASVYGSQDLVLSTSAPYTTVTIRSADGSFTKTVAVTSTGSTIVSLPTSVVMSDKPNTKERDKGLIITSGEPVQVTYRLTPTLNQDIVPLKCRAALGYAFYAGSQTRLGGNNNAFERHFVSVMATMDGTTVTFCSPIDLEGHPANVPFTVTLDAGQTYMVSSKVINNGVNTENKSVAGTLVTSDPDHPIVVNSGSQHTVQPYSGNRDAGIDQLVPARTAGTDYVAVHSLNTAANSDYVFIVAIENNTTVTISGPTTVAGTSSVLATATLQAGEVYTYNLPNQAQNRAFYIKTSKKAYAYHVSSYGQNEFGMGLLPAINPCNGSKRIDFYRTTAASNDQALVTIPSSGTSSLTFRGQPFSVYGTVIDLVTVNGVPQSIISFPNSSIAAVDNVNTLTSNERFHVGVVSNTGGGSTGNYGYYSNYEARVDVINAKSGQPDDFITVAQVTVGSPVDYCLTLTSCGTTNTIKSILPGKYTKSATFNNQQCVTYTMSTTAPICARDTIRVIVQNELGREGQVCLEYVNNNSDLIVNVLSSSPIICQPTGTVSLTVIPISTGGNFQYEWITPDKQVLTTQVIQGAKSGRYFVSVRDGNTCVDTTSFVIQADTPALKFAGSSTSSTSFCVGATVPYTLSATAGTYAWSVTNGTILSGGTPISQSATVRWGAAGTGTLRAVMTSINGCTASVTQTVTIKAAPTLAFSTQNEACFGQSTGQVNLTPSGGTTPYSYRWTGPTGTSATTEDLTNVPTGVYLVTVTDRGGCVTSGSAAVGQFTTIAVSSTVINVSCNGRNTGAISLSVTGGAPAYRYSWSSGGTTLTATTPSLTGLLAGTYVATVTDANNCIGSLTVVVTQPPAIVLTLTPQQVGCYGTAMGSIALSATGGTGALSYRWNTGATSSTVAGLVAGVYSVTVTDASGCTATAATTLLQPPALSLTTSRINPTCNGANTGRIDLTVSGGTGAYSYTWSTGQATQNLAGLVAGTYSVTVSDANDCWATTSVTLTQPAPLLLNATQQPVACFGGTTGSVALSPTGGTGAYAYRWNTGAANPVLTALSAGTYSVTVTDANQCSVVQPFSVTQPAALSLTATQQHIACNGASTGQIAVTVSGGKSPFAYAWAGLPGTGATTSTVASLAVGSYSVVVTDANNCVVSQTVSLTQPAAITPNLTKQNVACNGAATGSISLAPTGGTSPYTYLWTGTAGVNATAQNQTGLAAGSYSVTITDGNGCTAATSTIITQAPALTLSAAPQSPACFGSTNGRIDLTVSGGTGAYSYTWSTGQITQDLSGLGAGTYSVTVTDANGCSKILTVTLTNPPGLNATTTAQNPACIGSATGSINLSATGGTGAYGFRWNTGGTTASISALVAGVYSVTLTDANACLLIRSVTLTNPPALTLTATTQNPTCFGAPSGAINLTATGGTGAYTYLWTGQSVNGLKTRNITGVFAGTYQVTVTDANGCSQTLAVSLTNPPALNVALSSVPVSCNGASTGLVSLTTTGGTGGYSYRWAGPTGSGATGQSLTGIPAGAYSVTVTDGNGCVAKAQATIQQPSALSLTLAPQPVSCFGGSDGKVGLMVQGGSGAYTYAWNGPASNGVSLSALSGLGAGIYSVTVTDGNGCTGFGTTTVTQPAALSLTANTVSIVCFGGATGSIDILPSGGTAPYTYLWSDAGTTEDRTGLLAGTYSLTMTDANACFITMSRSLTQSPGLTATESHTNVGCTNSSNGAISLTPGGGVAPYTYLWSNGATTQAISGLTSNTYTVTITDANGCQLLVSVPIIQPIPLTIQPDPSLVLCNAQPASIVTDTRGGTSPYSYVWSNGATTASVYGLPSGFYSVVVTDINGCTATTSATIVEPPPFGVAASVTAVACNSEATGVISLKIEGATPPYALTMANAANTVISNSTLTTGLPAGWYVIKVVDSNSCVQSTTISISESPALTLETAATNVPCYGDQSGVVSLTASGGRTPFAYDWSGPMANGASIPTLTNIVAGTYSVVVTDANGCTATAIRSVTQPPGLTLGGSFDHVTCFGGNDGQITVFPAGGTVPYSYSWTGPLGNGPTTATNANLIAGVYSVTVTDGNGCSDELRFTIDQPTALSVAAFPENLTCFENASGKITLAVTGGNLPYTYLWNGPTGSGSTDHNRTGLAAGVYSVTVTDGHGCSEVRSITLTQPDALTLAGITRPVACFGAETGSISLTVSGGTGQRSFVWNDGSTNQDRAGLMAGIYSVSLADANQCAISQSFTITQPPALMSTVSSVSVACFGGTTGSISLTASGGTGPYSYSWNDGLTSQNRTALVAGNYLVVVTDANGCQTSNGVRIDQPTPLVLALTPTAARCFGSADGGITANVQGGTMPYSYSWNDGSTGQQLTALPAGTYFLTITDANACSSTAQTTVTQPAALTISGTQTNILCNGGTNGQANITVSGGTLPYAYSWNTGAVTSSINNVPAGVYSVTVTDANACFLTHSFTLTQPTAVSVAVSGTNVSCFGEANGTASLTATGGVGSYTYLWNTGSVNPTLIGLTAGIYSVMATDANQCSSQNSLTISQPTALTGRITSTAIGCYGGADGTIGTVIGGGTAPYNYSWMDVVLNAPDRTGLPVGTYLLNVLDAQECHITLSRSLTQPVGVVLTMFVVPPYCYGAADGVLSATALGGTPAAGAMPYTYVWNTGTSAQSLSGVSTGTYSVTATDANSCTATSTALVNEPTSLSLTHIAVAILCSGGNTGQLAVDVSGGTPGVLGYTYVWNTGATTPLIANLVAGVYSVTVTDANSCALVRSFTLTEPPALSLITDQTAIACFGGATGTASLTVMGGTPTAGSAPYEISWNTGSQRADLSGLTAGVYAVTVTDANRCATSTSLTLTQPTALSIDASTTGIVCFGESAGTISLTVAGGTAPYNYLWTDGATVSDRTSLTVGTYQVTVTDQNGCQTALTRTFTQPDLLRLQISPAAVSCFGGADGSLSVVVTGGNLAGVGQSYTYLWAGPGVNGVSTSVIAGLSAGVYSVTVTDANLCSQTMSETITQPAALSVSGLAIPASCAGGTDGAVSITASGGMLLYRYEWNNGATQPDQASIAAGLYSVTVTDGNGCSALLSLSVTEPPQLTVTMALQNNRCEGNKTGGAVASVTGGTGPYSYTWTDAQATTVLSNTDRIDNVSAGVYTVFVADANACRDTVTITLMEPLRLAAQTSVKNANCFGHTSGAISTTLTGGTGPYSYTWADGYQNPLPNTPDLTGLTAGAYILKIGDANNCQVDLLIHVGEPEPLSLTHQIVPVSCFGGTDGIVSLTASGGISPYSYTWTTGAATSSVNGLLEGTYNVILTDDNGCTIIRSYSVSQPATVMSLTGTATSIACFSGTDGAVSVTVTGGTPITQEQPYTYLWAGPGAGGASTSALTGLSAGVYSVTVTDASLCALTDSFTVGQSASLTVAGTVSAVSCLGGIDGAVSVTASGGTLPYAYAWSNGPDNSLNTGLSAGLYSVTITDGNGCQYTDSFTITQPNALSLVGIAMPVSCLSGTNGTVGVTVAGGSPASLDGSYTYLWANLSGTFSASAAALSGLMADVYTVIATDGNGCTATDSFTVSEPTAISLTTAVSAVRCFSGTDGLISVTATGGTLPYSYSWSNGQATSSVSGLSAGLYSITVADASGCTATTPVSVSQPPPYALNAVVSPVVCNGSATGSIDVTVEGATPGMPEQPYRFTWSTGAETEDIANLTAGTYSLTVTDANGCREEIQFQLTQADNLTLTGEAIAPTCAGPLPRPDGQLRLITFDLAWRYAISEGTSFTTTVADLGTLPSIPANGVLRNDLPNPDSGEGLPYTIRIFTADGCSKDLTLILPPAVCTCKPDICVPVRIRKTKG
ncbi:hypothetical protein [Fibrella aquatica]|uniref:hypothetical protein n=1 Tax=Fibrella aquatica TaxID=3242487 RepID=UPI0035215ABC